MPKYPRVYRSLCVLCGLLSVGVYVEALRLGGWFVFVGIVALLVGFIVGSLVVRRW